MLHLTVQGNVAALSDESGQATVVLDEVPAADMNLLAAVVRVVRLNEDCGDAWAMLYTLNMDQGDITIRGKHYRFNQFSHLLDDEEVVEPLEVVVHHC